MFRLVKIGTKPLDGLYALRVVHYDISGTGRTLRRTLCTGPYSILEPLRKALLAR